MMKVGWIRFGSTYVAEQRVDQLAAARVRLEAQPARPHRFSERGGVGIERVVDPRRLADRVAHGDPAPGRGQVDLVAVVGDDRARRSAPR